MNPLLPGWVVLPVALVLLLAVATHLLMVMHGTMPPSRKRIRMANGWLMLLLVPLGAAAFGVVAPADPRAFVLVWTLVISLLLLLIAIAFLDIVNTRRLHRKERRALREEHERRKRKGGFPDA